MITSSLRLRSPLLRIRVIASVVAVLAVAVIAGTIGYAQDSEKEPKKSSSRAREEMKTVASPDSSEESEPKPKPKPAKRKTTSKKKGASKSGTKKTAKKTPTPEPTKRPAAQSKGESKKASEEEEESKGEAAKKKAKATSEENEGESSEAPKPKHPKKTPTPEPTKTPSVKRKPKSSEEEEATPAKSKANKSGPAKTTPTPEPTKRPGTSAQGTPKASKTPPVEKGNVPEPTRAPTPEPHPTPVPVAPAQQNLLPSDITVEKSGLQKEQRMEPPPPAPPKRGFWPWSRQPTNYRYLTSANIDAIRRAPVQSGRWKFIIVHNSGTRQGNAKAFDYYHRKIRRMRNGLAYHFVIGNGTSSRNGQIEIGDRWVRQIAGGHVHSDYMNNIGLGICLVGDFNRDQPTRAQMDACEELIRYLRERCGKSDGRPLMVRPHREVNPPRWATDCPGDAFPYGWLGKLR